MQNGMINIHAHLFTADHTPEIQLFYMIKDILMKLFGKLFWIFRVRNIVERIERSKKVCFVVKIGMWIYSLFKPDELKTFIILITTVSNIKLDDLLEYFKSKHKYPTLYDLIRFISENVKDDFPVREVIKKMVKDFYVINRRNRESDKKVMQKDLFDKFKADNNYYKKMIALTMDFDNAFCNVSEENIERVPDVKFIQQCDELIKLSAQLSFNQANLQILPFLCVDPRRKYENNQTSIDFVKDWINKGFRGLKFYPPLGYLPEDIRLKEVFEYCAGCKIPIITHCGRGGAGRKGAINCSELAHPYYWIPVINCLKEHFKEIGKTDWQFKLCLAHFDDILDPSIISWWDEILKLIDDYDDNKNVFIYVDISFNVIDSLKKAKRFFSFLKKEMIMREKKDDKEIDEIMEKRSKRLLYGSDWWMFLYVTDEKNYYEYMFKKWINKKFYPFKKNPDEFIELLDNNAKRFLEMDYECAKSY